MFSLFTAIFIFKSSKVWAHHNCFVEKTIILVFDGLITKFAFLDQSLSKNAVKNKPCNLQSLGLVQEVMRSFMDFPLNERRTITEASFV